MSRFATDTRKPAEALIRHLLGEEASQTPEEAGRNDAREAMKAALALLRGDKEKAAAAN